MIEPPTDKNIWREMEVVRDLLLEDLHERVIETVSQRFRMDPDHVEEAFDRYERYLNGY